MSLTATIGTAVDSAFSAAGDLVKKGYLSEKEVSGFNFSTGETILDEVVYYIEFIETSSTLDKDRHIVKELVVRSKDLDGSRYSTLTYNSKLYRIETIQEYTGITQLTVRSV